MLENSREQLLSIKCNLIELNFKVKLQSVFPIPHELVLRCFKMENVDF